VFYDYYYHDDVSFGVSANTLYISPISFVRTFCQVHGYILSLKYTWLLIVIAAALIFSSVKVISSAKRLKDRQKQPFAITHLLIFVMQLLFACGAGSNAEFMVMLPFALLIFLSLRFEAPLKALYLLGGSLFVWNMSAGVIPAHTLELTPEPAVVRYIEANPRMTYCLFDLRTCETMLKYRHPYSQYRLNKGVTEIDSLLRSDGCIITDVWSPRAMSRATLLSSDEESGSAGCIIKRDTVEFSLGKAVMAQVCVCR